MQVTTDNFRQFVAMAEFDEPWIHNEKMDVSGGITTIEDIDELAKYPDCETVTISGLDQYTFEYFVKKYGQQFKAIRFHKNKRVIDWSLLSTLKNLEYFYWFFNQKITSLWDMSNNISLKCVCIEDFCKLKSIEGIEKAPNLERFYLGNAVWATSVIEDITCLKKSSICELSFYGKDILNHDFSFVIDMPHLQKCDFATNLLTTEQVAWIVANRPDLQGYCLDAIAIPVDEDPDNFQNFIVVGKGKRRYRLAGNEHRLEQVRKDFDILVQRYAGAEYPHKKTYFFP